MELLDAVAKRFRLRAALEGAVAEVQMERHIQALLGNLVERYEAHDLDGRPDFTIWVSGRAEPLRAECKNVRESSKPGGEAYRRDGQIVAYKVETQKTRAAGDDHTSRYYGIDQFEILGVCVGKKSGNWSNLLFVRTADLQRHKQHPHKLAVMQWVPLPDSQSIRPWYDDLGELIRECFTNE
jgi:hypothetical protein